jgi:hypothetical protein
VEQQRVMRSQQLVGEVEAAWAEQDHTLGYFVFAAGMDYSASSAHNWHVSKHENGCILMLHLCCNAM